MEIDAGDPLPNQCDPSAGCCVPDSLRCSDDGSALLRCSEAGSWGQTEACERGCDATGPQCRAPEPRAPDCDAQTPARCADTRVEACGDDGAWHVQRECNGDAPRCYQGACVACQPGDQACSGLHLRACKADGSGWEEQAVRADICGAQCTAGTDRCLGAVYSQCDDKGTWQPVQIHPDNTQGLFAAVSGSHDDDCGSERKPCALQDAIVRAPATSRPNIYVGTGTYNLDGALPTGITLIGGWDTIDGVWTRQCRADRAGSVVLQSTSNVGLLAEYKGTSKLDTLTIRARSASNPGESSYGVIARGNDTQLVLHEVVVEAAPGHEGAAGVAGMDVAASSGACAEGDGSAAPVIEGLAADGGGGSFDADGYHPAIGALGASGTAGGNGKLAMQVCTACMDWINAMGPSPCGDNCILYNAVPTQVCAASGANGCGGQGGAGGGGGQGGGSSIALYVYAARVTLENARLRAHDGADGAAGGGGGHAGAPSPGLAGPISQPCTGLYTSIFGDTIGMQQFGFPGIMGPPGSNGGSGADGQAGGAGAGGDSFAIVTAGKGAVSGMEGSMLEHGAPGHGANHAASGRADNLFSVR